MSKKIDRDTRQLQKQMAAEAESAKASPRINADEQMRNRAAADPLVRAMELLYAQGALPKDAAVEFRSGKMTRERAYEVWRGLAYSQVDKTKTDFEKNLTKSIEDS